MKPKTPSVLSLRAATCFLAALAIFAPKSTAANPPNAAANDRVIVYLTRHCEDVPEMVNSDPSFTIVFNNCNEDGSCCVEALNPLGRVRASALADWFESKRITCTLTHVIASHKIRTRESVEKIAKLAGLGGDLDGNGTLDGQDVDQAPGDGVINIPSAPAECDPGWTSSSSVRQPQIDYINTLPLGSRAVVCSHSPVIYPLMQAFGIDTADPVKFPKDSRGRVVGFNNLWVLELKPSTTAGVTSYQGKLLSHIQLDIDVDASFFRRDYGLKHGRGSRCDED